jgi:hypothetical protein
MSNSLLDGKQIESVYYPDGSRLVAKDDITLEWLNTFHGDHDVDWIIQKKSGKEVARFVARHAESITWKECVTYDIDPDQKIAKQLAKVRGEEE